MSKQEHFANDNNLFDPYNYSLSDVARLPAPQDSMRPKTILSFEETSTASLEQELLYRVTHTAPSKTTINLLEHLLVDRGNAPNALHYEALILNNADPEHGSADNIRTIMTEMEEAGISFNINVYTAVFKSLAVHPDIEVLDHVIESCNSMWIELDQEMLQLICAIYIRAGMLEIAEDYLDQIEGKGGKRMAVEPIDPTRSSLWLYVLLLRELALKNDWDGVLRICYRLDDDTSLGVPLAMRQLDIPYDFWLSLLKLAAQAKHEWVCDWIWILWVRRAYITPDPDLCQRLLAIFASAGYTQNVEDVRYILKEQERANTSTIAEGHGLDDANSPGTLKISKVPTQVTNSQIRAQFEQFGEVVSVSKSAIGRAAKVQFARTQDARRAREASDGLSLDGVRIRVSYMTPINTPDRPGRNRIDVQLKPSLRERYSHSALLDPFAVLTEESDAGRAWPRVLREQQIREERRLNTIARREAVEAERRKEQLIMEAKETMPKAILQDIELAANAISDDELLKVKPKTLRMDDPFVLHNIYPAISRSDDMDNVRGQETSILHPSSPNQLQGHKQNT